MTDYKKVFLDTAPVIYFLDNNEIYGKKVQHILEDIMEDGVFYFPKSYYF